MTPELLSNPPLEPHWFFSFVPLLVLPTGVFFLNGKNLPSIYHLKLLGDRIVQ